MLIVDTFMKVLIYIVQANIALIIIATNLFLENLTCFKTICIACS